MCASELDRSNESDELREPESTSLLEESTSPFIDEGDGFTSERKGVRRLLSLASHVGRYKRMVGAHNTVECQTHMGGGVAFFGYGRRRRLPHC